MANLTIRNIDDDLKALLRLQATRHGCSMEQEVRNILRQALQPPTEGLAFAARLQQRFAGLEADELPLLPRLARPTPAAQD